MYLSLPASPVNVLSPAQLLLLYKYSISDFSRGISELEHLMSPVESFQKLGINVIKLVDYLQPFSPFAPISNASKDAVL